MKAFSSIQIKAAFLTIVFLLNTVIGFACAMEMDVEPNGDHHQKNETSLVGKNSHEHNEADEHDASASDHHSSKSAKDNCCKDEVSEITKGDKIVQQSFDYKLLILPVFTLTNPAYLLGSVNSFPINTKTTYDDWRYRPPISDIRIAIQSFQI